MKLNDELVYLFRRCVEERIRAETATHEGARHAHRQLALCYDQRLRRQPGGARWLDAVLPQPRMVPQRLAQAS